MEKEGHQESCYDTAVDALLVLHDSYRRLKLQATHAYIAGQDNSRCPVFMESYVLNLCEQYMRFLFNQPKASFY